jgi:hypothetical protein
MFARLSPKKFLALHLIVGPVTLITAAWLFGEIVPTVVKHDQFLV